MMRGHGRGRVTSVIAAAVLAVMMVPAAPQAQKARERELGLPIGGTPGPLDAITDVAGVEVGHTTLISGERPARAVARARCARASPWCIRGARPIPIRCSRLVHPERQRRDDRDDVGAGERPARGAGRDHQHPQRRRRARRDHPLGSRIEERAAAVVAPGRRRDLRRHARTTSTDSTSRPEHVLAALDGATGGLPLEGNVGGGTGMVCHGFKGGIGTASRQAPRGAGRLHRRCAGAVQLRHPSRSADRGCAGR